MSDLSAARFLVQLAGNLGDFGVFELDAALEYLRDEAGKALRTDNNHFAICIREPEGGGLSPVGWLPVWEVRHGPDRDDYSKLFRDWYSEPRNYGLDATVVALAKTSGAPRAFRRREVVSDDEWRQAPIQELFDAISVGDRLVTGVPAGPGTEIVVTSYRRCTEQGFSEEDRELAALVAAAVRPFCTRLALTYGFGDGLTPLTPRERSVLKALLTGAAEKEVARDLGLTTRSLHQYVVSVYRKLGVTSRAQLMALFLSPHRPDPPG